MLMNKSSLGLLFQLIASVSWMISTFVYGLQEPGDYLQLLASTAWTISNIVNYLNNSK
jgi:hypothetical protein